MENTIYVGKYKVPKGGIVKLPHSKLRVLSSFHYHYHSTGKVGEDDRVTIVAEEKDFWPFISKMSLKEAEKLRDILTEVIEYKKTGKKDQISREI